MNTETIRLEHAFLTVRDLDRSLAFYRKLFPAWVTRWSGKPSHGSRWVHFGPSGDGQPAYLSLCENTEAADDSEPYETVRIQHIGFSHPDVNALIGELSRGGVEPSAELMDDGRYRRIYFADPDGHELEFVQKLPAA
ncbi:MAG: VOC family protein [Candidatus Wallbacteria bacterium]|nr:VOC family protein [Candidatus Wallbacteria bacterium]MBI4865681.1 VOC family protein [Candidatus Wallbacteria bacterium]